MINSLKDITRKMEVAASKDKSRLRIPKLFQYPKIIRVLYLIFGAYLVLPVIDVPFLGLSLSAPIFFVISLTCILKPPRPWFRPYSGWIVLASCIWLGIFISTWANGLISGGIDIGQTGILTVIRYIYWLIVFVITTYFFSQRSMTKNLIPVLGWAVLGLALLRWFEVFRFGNYGAWSGTRFLTQNTYGFLFSTFSPFLLSLLYIFNGWKRIVTILGNLTVLGAVAINGSRGSWVAVAAGLGLSLIFLLISNRKGFFKFLTFIIITLGITTILWGVFPQVARKTQERFNTFDTLGQEKSYMVRQLMIQKGLRLFQESPIIGVGANRFTLSSTPLDIPRALVYGGQEYFDTRSSHNSYIGFLAEYGLIGSIPFGIMLLILGYQGIRSTFELFNRGNPWVLPIFVSFIQMSIHMWAISSLTNTGNWFVYGLVAAVVMMNKNPEKE